MRILSVCTSTKIFGAETITLKMLEGFKHRGHEQLAVTSIWTDGDFSRRLESLGIAEVRLPLGALSKRISWQPIWWTTNALLRLPSLWFGWSRLLRRFRPEVVLFTSSRQCLLLLPWLAAQPSFVIEYTNVAPRPTYRRLYGRIGRKAAGFIAVSEFMRAHLARVGAPADKIHVIRSGTFFESDKCATERTIASFAQNRSGPFRIGFVGQVAANKGPDCLVEAVRLLGEREIRVVVKIFGSGDPQYVNRLKDKIAEVNLAEIWEWMGYERDKGKIFGSMDVCVVPSGFGDPFPTVAMEAGVHGLPVVASRIGGLPEIVEDGVTGWLVEPNSPVQLADKLEWLIKNPDRAREMGAAGRRKVFQQFTVEKMVAEFETLFREFT